jgi:myo-inositol-1(or 4)-monophosphatase
MQPMLYIAETAARSAARIILRSFDRVDQLEITEKSKNNFATEVDRKAEKEIIKTLLKAYPNHGILAEESGSDGDNTDERWIIDPLDGTTNYIRGIPHFSISIAFQKDGKIEHGLIYDPLRDEMFTASRGYGARINGKRIRVSKQTKIENALIGTGFPSHDSKDHALYLKTFNAIFKECASMRRAGSAALDLAYVASGRFDGFWENGLSPWDIAAGALIVKEAGGMVADFTGAENFLDNGSIVAGNPRMFKSLLQLIIPELNKDSKKSTVK